MCKVLATQMSLRSELWVPHKRGAWWHTSVTPALGSAEMGGFPWLAGQPV